jgi:hypothetical protein
MKRLLSLLLVLSLSSPFTARTQVSQWQRSSHWTLYNVGGAKFYSISVDSLKTYNSRPLSDDTIHDFLAHVFLPPSDKPPVWMGAYVATCIIDGHKRKIDISSYGGFFFDEAEKKYYSVSERDQKDWLDYLANCAGSIPLQK